jgi:hypothetical protein
MTEELKTKLIFEADATSAQAGLKSITSLIGGIGDIAATSANKISGLGDSVIQVGTTGLNALGALGNAIAGIANALNTPVGQEFLSAFDKQLQDAVASSGKLSDTFRALGATAAPALVGAFQKTKTELNDVLALQKELAEVQNQRSNTSRADTEEIAAINQRAKALKAAISEARAGLVAEKPNPFDDFENRLSNLFESQAGKLGASAEKTGKEVFQGFADQFKDTAVGKQIGDAIGPLFENIQLEGAGDFLFKNLVQDFAKSAAANTVRGQIPLGGLISDDQIFGALQNSALKDILPTYVNDILKGNLGTGIGKFAGNQISFSLLDSFAQVRSKVGDLGNATGSEFATALVKGGGLEGSLTRALKQGLDALPDQLQETGAVFKIAFPDQSAEIDKAIKNTTEVLGKVGEEGGVQLVKTLFSKDEFVERLKEATKGLDKEVGGILIDTLTVLGQEAAIGFGKGFAGTLFETIAPSLDQIDQLISSSFTAIQELPERFIAISDAGAAAVGSLSGIAEPLGLFSDIKQGISGLVGGISQIGQELFFFGAAIQTVQQIVNQGPFRALIAQNEELQAQLLSTRASIVSTSQVIANGQNLGGDSRQALNALEAPVNNAIAKLRQGSLELVGVTSNDLVPLFQQIAQQATNIGASLDDVASLSLSTAAALGTLQIPLFQSRQEIQSILTATIDQNSILAKSLGINNDMVRTWISQGTAVKEITKRLEAFRVGNSIAANSIDGITSNIQELFDEITRKAGEPFLEPIRKQFEAVFQFINENKTAIGTFVQGLAGALFGAIDQAVKGISVIIKSLGPLFALIPQYLAGSALNAVTAFADAIVFTAGVLQPFINILTELIKLIAPLGGIFLGLFATFTVFSGATRLLSGAFSTVIAILPGLGELLFTLNLRTGGLINTFGSLSGLLGRGASGFLLLGKNMQVIPGLASLITTQLVTKFGPIGGIIASAVPQIASFGTALAGLAKINLPFREALQGFIKASPDVVRSLGNIASQNVALAPFSKLFDEAAKSLSVYTNNARLGEVITGQFDKQIKSAGLSARNFVLQTATLGAGLFIGAIAFDQLILKNEGLKKAFAATVKAIRDAVNAVSSFFAPITNAIGSLFTFADGLLPKILLAALAFTQVGNALSIAAGAARSFFSFLNGGLQETLRLVNNILEKIGLIAPASPEKRIVTPDIPANQTTLPGQVPGVLAPPSPAPTPATIGQQQRQAGAPLFTIPEVPETPRRTTFETGRLAPIANVPDFAKAKKDAADVAKIIAQTESVKAPTVAETYAQKFKNGLANLKGSLKDAKETLNEAKSAFKTTATPVEAARANQTIIPGGGITPSPVQSATGAGLLGPVIAPTNEINRRQFTLPVEPGLSLAASNSKIIPGDAGTIPATANFTKEIARLDTPLSKLKTNAISTGKAIGDSFGGAAQKIGNVAGAATSAAKDLLAAFGPAIAFAAAVTTIALAFEAVEFSNKLATQSLQDYKETVAESLKALELLRIGRNQDAQEEIERLKELKAAREASVKAEGGDIGNDAQLTAINARLTIVSEQFRKIGESSGDAFKKGFDKKIDDFNQSFAGRLRQGALEAARGVLFVTTLGQDIDLNKTVAQQDAANAKQGVENTITESRSNARLIEDSIPAQIELQTQLAELQNKLAKDTANQDQDAIAGTNAKIETKKKELGILVSAAQANIDGLKKTVPIDEEQARRLAKEIKAREELLVLINKTNTQIKPPKLEFLGSATAQTAIRLEQAVDSFRKADAEGAGQADQVQKQATEAIGLIQQLQKAGALSAEQVRAAADEIAGSAFIDAKIQIDAQELITASYGVEGNKRVDQLKADQAEIEQLIAGGRLSQIEGDKQLSDLRQEQLQIQLKSEEDAQARRDVDREKNFQKDLADIEQRKKEAIKNAKDTASLQEAIAGDVGGGALVPDQDRAQKEKDFSDPGKNKELDAVFVREQQVRRANAEQTRQSQKDADSKLRAQRAVAAKDALDAAKKQRDEELQLLETQQNRALDVQKAAQTERLNLVNRRAQGGDQLRSEVEGQRLTIQKQTTERELQIETIKLSKLQEILKNANLKEGAERDALEAKIRASKQKTLDLTGALLDQENALFENFIAQITEELENANRRLAAQTELQNAGLQRQVLLLDLVSKALDQQNKLTEARKGLDDARSNLLQTEFSILAKTAKSEQQKEDIAKRAAVAKLEALLKAQEVERRSLAIQLQQNRLAIERRDIENQIAISKAQVEERSAAASIEAAQKGLALKPGDIELQLKLIEAQARLENARSTQVGLGQERQLIGTERRLLPEQEALAIEKVQTTQKDARLQGQQAVVDTLGDRDPLRRQLQNQILQEVTGDVGNLASQGQQARAGLERVFNTISGLGNTVPVNTNLQGIAGLPGFQGTPLGRQAPTPIPAANLTPEQIQAIINGGALPTAGGNLQQLNAGTVARAAAIPGVQTPTNVTVNLLPDATALNQELAIARQIPVTLNVDASALNNIAPVNVGTIGANGQTATPGSGVTVQVQNINVSVAGGNTAAQTGQTAGSAIAAELEQTLRNALQLV